MAAVGLIVLFGPAGRYLIYMPGGKEIIFAIGFLVGFLVNGWWNKTKDGEEEQLRRRLVSGEIRLTEYRLLRRELGIGKKKPTSLKNEEEFSSIDGT